ncbi:Nramp family divalent metal transporter [Nitrosomonas sp.]|uniref:Nramp family divalent metal transporter n=1 Tax=Nitrosomonas sp. TaxID=42353 RepID=UPI00261E266D|nr:Nramp family divalent metal transporter [Nitrosomonas sp.]MCW5602401.1 Nramp family divalent metal transporter [Nitrosomonas sp.]
MSLKDKLGLFGPGLLYAGAAVGVSHLVQSTRAGAEFGFQLVAIVLLVNMLKYPIFEAGPRYAAATGRTLLDGYRSIGAWAVWVYVLLSSFTMFIVMGAISIVTAGLFMQLTGIDIEVPTMAMLLLFLSVLILGFGHYSTLDQLMKLIIITLTISTLFALAFSLLEPVEKQAAFENTFNLSDHAHILFLVALIGWMPAPVDISIWHSMWSVSKNKEQGYRIPLSQALLDFKIGYWGTTLLAVCFLALGALIMYGTPESPAPNSTEFAKQFINLYTINLGQWAFPFIALAAFTTMFSTLLTCLDAYPRTLRRSTEILITKYQSSRYHNGLYWFWLLLTVSGTTVLLHFYLRDMRAMVDLATTISFILAPVLAILNYIALHHPQVPDDAKLSGTFKYFYLTSTGLLIAFSLLFLLYGT